MKYEIKEILDKCTYFLFGDEVDKLLYYITSLERKNDELKKKYLDAVANYEEQTYKISKAKKVINYYAIEDDDYSKLYNIEEQDILKALEGEKNGL